jgi:exopolyphosphatase/guanosine-5'-triphosphate,3'-diphosphate pyrophosphatase
MPRAAIDIGSNSLLLTVVDDAGAVLHDEARVVGLGRGLGDRGLFAPERLRAAEAVLTEYVEVARRHGVAPDRIKAVATSAARRAMNAGTWVSRVQRTLGLRVRVITGEEEARLTWLGALRDLDLPDGPVLVVDIGGGSTEIVLGVGGRVVERVSLEVGSVRLTEAFLGGADVPHDAAALARLRNHVDVEMQRLRMDPLPRMVIAVAGTVTTLATMTLGLTSYDHERVHGSRLTRADLASHIDRLLRVTPAERRRLVPAGADRADFLVAGATILDRALEMSRRSHVVVSDRGLRFGLLAPPGSV